MNKSTFTLLLLTLLFLSGCNRKQSNPSPDSGDSIEKDTKAEVTKVVEEEPVPDIEIALDIDYSNHPIGGPETLKYKIVPNDHYFIVEPTSPYYDAYVSGEDFEISDGIYNDCVDYNVYPKFYCYIQNTTDEKITIRSLDFEVASSSIDTLPYFSIFTEDDMCNHIAFANESWFNYGGATFEYTILKKGETFHGYKKRKHIPYFKDYYNLNLTRDLVSMGYNYKRIRKVAREEFFHENDVEMEDDNEPGCVALYYQDYQADKLAYLKKLVRPFEVVRVPDDKDFYMGIARIYGRLTFDNVKFSVRFHGRLILTYPAGFGAGFDEDDSYSIKLKTEGQNYVVKYPYKTTLKPHEARKIGVTILCPKSSNHLITVRATNNAGLQIFSKKIRLHYLNPRHSSKVVGRQMYQGSTAETGESFQY